MTTPRDPDEILSAWLDEGPTRLPDQTRRAIAVAIPTTTQRRRGWTAPWRHPSVNTIARTAVAVLAVVAVAGGVIYALRPGGVTATAGATATSSPSESSSTPLSSPATTGASPAASVAVKAFVSKGSPSFALDLTSAWVSIDQGDQVSLRYLYGDGRAAAAEIVYLDRVKVVGSDGVNMAAPADFLSWLETNPLLHPTSAAIPMTIAGLSATRLDVVGSNAATPSGLELPDYRFTFLSTGIGDLSIVHGEPWSFVVIDGPGGARILVAMQAQTADGQTKILDLLSTLRFP